jgi:general secretion pathway protein A
MYESFYNFRRKPFELGPDTNFMFKSPKHHKALAYLEYGLSENVGFLVLTGEVGCGKTITAKFIIRELGKTFISSYISNTHLSSPQMIRAILSGFGLPAHQVEKFKALDVLPRFLLTMRQKNKRMLVVIDEAQNLSARALEEVRLLSNIEQGGALLQILLIGQPELLENLKKPALRQLAQRVAVHYHLPPLDRKETGEYIAHRLGTVGGRPDLFTPAAVDKVFELSAGVPRLINLACEAALVYGFADDCTIISQDIIRQIASDRIGVGLFAPIAEGAGAAPGGKRKSAQPHLNGYEERIASLEREVAVLKDLLVKRLRELEQTLAIANTTRMAQLLEKNRDEQLQSNERLVQRQDDLEQKLNVLTRKGISDESTAGGRSAPKFYEDRPFV